MITLTTYGNADAAVIKLLRSLNVNVDTETITAELGKHPDYPSLLAISDVLTAFNVENNAWRLDFDELEQAPLPYLAHLKTNGGDLVLVKRSDQQHFFLASDKWANHKVTIAEFRKMYNGVVLIAQAADAPTGHWPNLQFFKALKTPVLWGIALLTLAAVLSFNTGYLANLSWPSLALALFKTAGLLTSVLLLIQSIDSNNPLVQVLCQTQGKTNCNAILSSKAAKVFEGLSWSEVGFYYFAGTWLLTLFRGGSEPVWTVLALLNFVSLPYTFYSIYHQWRVTKQWCVLCCTVQVLLWLEFAAIMFHLQNEALTFNLNLPDATTIVASLLSPVILWLSLKPLFLKLQQLKPLKEQLRTFKYNSGLFNKMLTAQPRFAPPAKDWSIVLGNPEAENVITMISNPYCPPCSATHALLDQLLNDRADIQARIIFTASNDARDHRTPVSRHLMGLSDSTDSVTMKKALHDWYEQKQKSYEAWAKIYPVELNASCIDKIDRQREWCQMAEVSATPTLLLNGYRLPGLYRLNDLKYMLG